MRVEIDYQKEVGDGLAFTSYLRQYYGDNLLGLSLYEVNHQEWVRLYFHENSNLSELDGLVAAFRLGDAPPSLPESQEAARQAFLEHWEHLQTPIAWLQLSDDERQKIVQCALLLLAYSHLERFNGGTSPTQR